MPSLIFNRADAVTTITSSDTGGGTPTEGKVVSVILSMISVVMLSLLLARRVAATPDWGKVPFTRWITFAVYVDSIIFIIASTILERAFGVNTSYQICDAAILLCLTCYLTTKALLFLFLVEKVYIIQRVRKPRLRSPLYCFNVFCLIVPYIGIIVLNFVYRIASFNKNGICIIGMERISVMPLIIVDACVNFYLTLLFVVPLRRLYSYQQQVSPALRTITFRSFIGSLATLTSSVVNLTVLMVLNGEQAWICLMLCNADILFSVIVLHWVTSKDSSFQNSQISSNDGTATGRSPTKSKSATAFDRSQSKSRDYSGPTVTTQCTASNPLDPEDNEDNIALKKIRVQVEHTHAVERVASSETSEEDRKRSHHASTEDLVLKNEIPA
ncbi:hypothetical protein BJ878DRAFT_546356 [Calycina marina]|uniref:Transmembrane protein n=1 Tax=Calycina marina TaxID=1763456 RepID=A0A9P7YWE2_9HELO|nr:hypothetical protein BJ878DRAFT_546356 [Calycina marina]